MRAFRSFSLSLSLYCIYLRMCGTTVLCAIRHMNSIEFIRSFHIFDEIAYSFAHLPIFIFIFDVYIYVVLFIEYFDRNALYVYGNLYLAQKRRLPYFVVI